MSLGPAWAEWISGYSELHGETPRSGLREKYVARGSAVCTPGPYLVVLFGEVLEPLEGAALLQEVRYWGMAMNVFKASPHFQVTPASFLFQLPAAMLPQPQRTLSLWNHSQYKPFGRWLLVMVFTTRTEKEPGRLVPKQTKDLKGWWKSVETRPLTALRLEL